MKQVLIDVLPFEFKKTSLNESIRDGKLIVSGVLQRAEAKNQNGRIYPKEMRSFAAGIRILYNPN